MTKRVVDIVIKTVGGSNLEGRIIARETNEELASTRTWPGDAGRTVRKEAENICRDNGWLVGTVR